MSLIEGTRENPAEVAISIQAIRFILLNTTIRPYMNADNSRFSHLNLAFISIMAEKPASRRMRSRGTQTPTTGLAIHLAGLSLAQKCRRDLAGCNILTADQ